VLLVDWGDTHDWLGLLNIEGMGMLLSGLFLFGINALGVNAHVLADTRYDATANACIFIFGIWNMIYGIWNMEYGI